MLGALNKLSYYGEAYPKSLANDFGTSTVYPLIQQYQLSPADALCTFAEHIAIQIKIAVQLVAGQQQRAAGATKMLVTGGGGFNTWLVNRITEQLQEEGIEVVVPDEQLVNYKEALVMALIGVLRWREEYNVLCSVTGAARNSINGALWLGGEA